MNYDIIDAEYKNGFVIWVEFKDGSSGEIDFKDEFDGPIFEPLKDVNYFKTFKLVGNTLS